MNSYQKAGVLAVRIVGYGMALVGAMGVGLFVGLALFEAGDLISYPRERLVSGAAWLLVGSALILFAQPAGRRLGRGLG